MNSFCFWNHSVTIFLITLIEICSQSPLKLNNFISFNQQKPHIFLLNSVMPNLIASFAFFGIAFSSIVYIISLVTLTKSNRSWRSSSMFVYFEQIFCFRDCFIQMWCKRGWVDIYFYWMPLILLFWGNEPTLKETTLS